MAGAIISALGSAGDSCTVTEHPSSAQARLAHVADVLHTPTLPE